MSWGFDLMDDVQTSRSVREQARAVIARADVLIVDNDGPRRVALELGAAASKIFQFPWGIDLEAFHPGPSEFWESLSSYQGEIVVLCTRRHEAVYDVETVVAAFIAAAPLSPRLRLLLAGSGTQTSQLKATVQDSGFEARVVFLGEIDQSALPSIYRGADLYVSPSRVDGSSVSLLEAMASGVPVCVSDIEGNRQWIADDRGLSFPVGDVGRLSSLLTAFAAGSSEAVQRAMTRRRGRALDYVTKHANWSDTRKALPGIARMAIEKNSEHK
jgi:glycosyltransferase involved in cell wall biosynthesis